MSILAPARTVGGVLARADVDPADDLLAGAHLRHDPLHVLGRQPVDDGSVTEAAGEAQHPRPERRHEDRRHHLGRPLQPEALHGEGVVGLGHLLSREGSLEEAHHVPVALVRLDEGDAVPALDDHVRGRAEPELEPARRGLGEGGDATSRASPARG